MLGAFRGWVTAAQWRRTALRYLATVLAVLGTLVVAVILQVGDKGSILGFAVVMACAWWGGLGPSILAPSVMLLLVRWGESHGDWHRVFDFTPKAIVDCTLLFLISATIGLAGQLRRKAQAIARQHAAKLEEQARALRLAHLIFHDLDGRITSWNDGAQRIYGWTREQAEGRTIYDLLRTISSDPVPDIIDELSRSGQWTGELTHSRRDGSQLIVASHWILYRGETAARPVVAQVNNDVTEARRAEAALRQADRCKDQFLATLAHELRNPLAPIRTGLETLRQTGAPTSIPSDEIHAMLERQVGHLVRLIDDLLDVSRVNAGKIALSLERVDLADIVDDAVEAAGPHIQAARHELRVELPDGPLPLVVDRTRIAQALLNLLNNAAKFTDPGGRVTLSARHDRADLEISVRDSGIGIPPDMLPQVFGLFTQVDGTAQRSRGGLGIGLNLVKTLVEMHHGTVEARSAGRGAGSEFIVRLPMATLRARPDDLPTPDGAASALGNEPRRILVVDDSRDTARSLAMLLTMKGHLCQTAFDGPGALAAAADFDPDVFVLDIGLPGMNGYEVARRIRATSDFQSAKLIAVTGWGQAEDRRRVHESGFDHHLVKPINLGALTDLLSTNSQTSPQTNSQCSAQ
ncbi:MAG TPA: ATP-binding protein [Planctomycetaceae bacterium]|jgi:PAS domain S-box-containing protein